MSIQFRTHDLWNMNLLHNHLTRAPALYRGKLLSAIIFKFRFLQNGPLPASKARRKKFMLAGLKPGCTYGLNFWGAILG